MMNVTRDNVMTSDNANIGRLTGVSASGNIATLTITIDDQDYPVMAERRITLDALDNMFGENWHDQPVQFHVDPSGMLIWIAPAFDD